jgi:vanillate monooxygenase ferredoxin subunit
VRRTHLRIFRDWGDVLEISQPRNLFRLAPRARKSLLFAGGIGITPILCMAEQLSQESGDFEMHYCARSEDRVAFRSRLAESSYADAVHFHFDDQDVNQKLDFESVLGEPQLDTRLYVCGPKGFMDAVLGFARDSGWPESQIHYECFEAEELVEEDSSSFDVKIASSGQTITIPAGKRVTEVLEEHGIKVPTSCSQGVCGTCLTGVLEGTPDHRDNYLTPEEQEEGKLFLPCCSRAKTPFLALDL